MDPGPGQMYEYLSCWEERTSVDPEQFSINIEELTGPATILQFLDRQTDRLIDKYLDRYIDRQIDRQIGRQIDRQINRQINTKTEGQRYRSNNSLNR